MRSNSNAAQMQEKGSLCIFNGVDGTTGEYLQSPVSARRLAGMIRRSPPSFTADASRAACHQKELAEGQDPRDLGQTGWGVVFAEGEDPAIREALAPLLAHRRAQADRVRAGRYREISYRPGESKMDFLNRLGVAPGPVQPDSLPYYLLLVGDPERLPFEFQYQLDIQYGVGRIHLDTPEDYARYARTVVAVENGELRRRPAASFFGPRNPGDAPTSMSCDHLAAPLAKSLAAQLPHWSVRTSFGAQATKASLGSMLTGDETPALIFTAGHGLCYRDGDAQQLTLQGSLVCQDWPGPGQPIDESHYFSADDVPECARIAGLVSFHFSCYGAGTPRWDGFPVPVYGRRQVAPRAFLSRLANRLLAHPCGGALAVVGHVDRAWGWSYAPSTTKMPPLPPVFESTLRRLLIGYPLGYAMEFFSSCYSELASDLTGEISHHRSDRDEFLVQLWTNRNDVRDYAVLGDPAVRLAVGPEDWLQ